MSSNVGLTTPRGSGTSGYVQRNLSALKPRQHQGGLPYSKDADQWKHKQRQPDKELLEHDRKRAVEVKVFELRDRLEDEGVEEDDVDDQCDALRKKLESERAADDKKFAKPDARGLKQHQVHELAEAKIEESEKLRKALGISKDYEEGGHWRKQEERMRKSLAEGEDAEGEADGKWREKVRQRESGR